MLNRPPATKRVEMPEPAWRAELANRLRHACEIDVLSMKPGNVSIASPGHGMSADDFLASAAAILDPMTRPGFTVGERILASIAATRSVVECNTNLGIVLLCAPLSHAALDTGTGQSFRQALEDCLARLTVDDAGNAYAAIRLTQPAGLGKRATHDVAEVPTISLREAMIEARDEDFIARQYANAFAEILGCLPIIGQLRRRWNDDRWVATAVFLDLLARNPDSHIVRKFGLGTALRVSHEALPLAQAALQSAEPDELVPHLRRWDEQLKSAGINPGTTADLTVAAIYASGIMSMYDLKLTASAAISRPLANQPWEQSRILAN
jgi:triphosphoribosyl-dephospho-CoA synthase